MLPAAIAESWSVHSLN